MQSCFTGLLGVQMTKDHNRAVFISCSTSCMWVDPNPFASEGVRGTNCQCRSNAERVCGVRARGGLLGYIFDSAFLRTLTDLPL